MTDEQIKKGLECCTSFTERIDCFNKMCPYTNDCYSTIGDEKQIFVDALALINRLEEEKKKVRKETAKEILQSFAQFRAVSPALSATWYALAEKYGVEIK